MTPAEHAKAKAEAKAREKAEADAEARAAVFDRRRPRMTASSARAEKPVPSPQPGRLSPAGRRKAYLVASGAGAMLASSGLPTAASLDDINLSGDVAKMVIQLEADRRRLKDIKATDRKIEAKRQMLPFYKGWIDGFMANAAHEKGPFDQIFTQLMAWTIDTGDYLSALPMLEHVMDLGLEMPAQFNRDPITFVIDQVCEAALSAYDLGGEYASAFDSAILPALQDLVKEHEVDLHDEVEAKLFKTLGRAILNDADGLQEGEIAQLRARQQAALDAYRTAFAKHDRVGVKKDIEKLERELKKTDPNPS